MNIIWALFTNNKLRCVLVFYFENLSYFNVKYLGNEFFFTVSLSYILNFSCERVLSITCAYAWLVQHKGNAWI